MYFETIRPKDVERYALHENSILIDLRYPCDYEAGHIDGAVNIPYEDILDYTDDLSHYSCIVLYCDRGNLSLLGARDLAKEGCTHLYSLYGGYNAYKMYRNNTGHLM